MAKGKKSSGKNYQSKGERPNVNKKLRNAIRRDYMANTLARTLNQQEAWAKGKNVVLTIANPNTNDTKQRFIRVPATDVWGRPGNKYMMKESGVTEIKV